MAVTKKRALAVLVPVVLVVCVAIACVLAFAVDWNKSSSTEDAPDAMPTSSESGGAKILNNEPGDDKILDQWIVTFYEDAPIDSVANELAESGMPWFVNETFYNASSMYMYCQEEMLNEALAMPMMRQYAKYVEPDRVLSINVDNWGLDRINQVNLPLDNRMMTTGTNNGAGVNVYVLDTGIRLTHEQFGGRAKSGANFVNDGQGTNDCNGHGTHVAGSVGGRTYGVAKGANLHAVRVLGCTGSGSNSGVIKGVEWVTSNHVKPAIASMSLGGGVSSALDQAVKNSIARGVTYVVAAGNENTDACNGSPSRVPNAITVGATTKTDARASYSNYGSCVDVFAPGSSIPSAWYTADNAAATLSGTSMATPHVSGVAALYLQNNPNASPDQVTSALLNLATDGKVSSPGSGSPNKNLYWPDGSGSGSSTTGRPSTTGAATTGRVPSTTGVATTGAPTTGTPDIPSPSAGPCASLRCTNETGTLRSSGSVEFHPSGTHFYSRNGGSIQAWMDGPRNADFDLALFKWSSRNWIKVAGSETARSSESVQYTGTSGYYTWRVRSYDGRGSYTIAMVNP